MSMLGLDSGARRHLFRRCASGRLVLPVALQRNVRAKAEDRSAKSDDALSTLDSLLGEPGAPEASPNRDPNLVEWWRVRPRQAAPPRTTSVSSSKNPAGRFIANEEMLRNEVWAGRKTLLGQALALPKVTPYMSYVLALVNVAVYGTLVRLYDTQGSEAAAELLSGIAFSSQAVAGQGQLWLLLSGCLVQPDLASLAVVLYGMLVVAPAVEASLGYRTFAAALVMSTLVAADIVIGLGGSGAAAAGAAAAPPAAAAVVASTGAALLDAALHPVSAIVACAANASAACGPAGRDVGLWLGGLGAAAGLAGCAAAHEAVNGDVERTASGGEAGTSGSGSGGGSGLRGSGPRAGLLGAGGALPGGLLAVGALAATLLHAGESGAGAGGAAVLVAGVGAGFGTGFLLASIAGPRYQVTREVELPEGSMWIPDPDAVEEVTVVLDQTTSIQRTLATGALGVATAAVSVAVLVGGGAGGGV